MSDINWQRVEELYQAALNCSPDERKAYLDEACANEPPQVREQVEALLNGSDSDDEAYLNDARASTATEMDSAVFLPPGTRLLDRYVVGLRLDPPAGMSFVYKAVDAQFTPPAPRAVKTLRPETVAALGPEALKRLKAEANAMSRITDDRFVRIYDVGEWEGRLFLVMEWIDGGTLKDRLGEKWTTREAARLVAQLADAMSVVHTPLDIVHRDLKPANVLLTRKLAPKITDFGIAKLKGELADGGRVMGTPEYMAPEQWEGDSERIGPAADIYALGVMLYELLTGRQPYDLKGKTFAEMKAIVNDSKTRPANPRSVNAKVDGTLSAICLKCLEKNPQQRHRSADGLAAALERWLAYRPQDEDGWRRRLWLWCCRNPLGVGLLGIGCAFVALLGVSVAGALQEPARTQKDLARYQARTISNRLKQFQAAVESAARDRGLGKLLKEKDHAALQQAIEREGKERVDLNGTSPFSSWFILDSDEQVVARWPARDDRLSKVKDRDYFKGAWELAQSEGGTPAYVSRVYQSVLPEDRRYKFSVSAALRHDNAIVGVLAVTITTGPDLGLADIRDGESVTVLLAEKDPSLLSREDTPPASASRYLVLLHPDYEPGEQPIWFPKSRLHEIEAGVSRNYRDPVGEVKKEYGGDWLAAFAPVEGTPFIVIAQRPSPTLPAGVWITVGAIALVVLAMAILGYYLRRKRARSARAVAEASLLSGETQPWLPQQDN